MHYVCLDLWKLNCYFVHCADRKPQKLCVCARISGFPLGEVTDAKNRRPGKFFFFGMDKTEEAFLFYSFFSFFFLQLMFITVQRGM